MIIEIRIPHQRIPTVATFDDEAHWIKDTQADADAQGYEIKQINNGWLAIYGSLDNVDYSEDEPDLFRFLKIFAGDDLHNFELCSVEEARRILKRAEKNHYQGHGTISVCTQLEKILEGLDK